MTRVFIDKMFKVVLNGTIVRGLIEDFNRNVPLGMQGDRMANAVSVQGVKAKRVGDLPLKAIGFSIDKKCVYLVLFFAGEIRYLHIVSSPNFGEGGLGKFPNLINLMFCMHYLLSIILVLPFSLLIVSDWNLRGQFVGNLIIWGGGGGKH